MRGDSRVNPNDVIRDIRAGKIRRVYLLHGEEEYLIETTLNKMIEALLPDETTRSFNLEYLDGRTVSVGEVIVASEIYPLGASRRVIVVREPAFLTGEQADPMDMLRKSIDALRADKAPRSAVLLAKALGISTDDMTDPSTFQTALAKFKSDNQETLDRDEIEVLDRAYEEFRSLDIPSSGSSDDSERFMNWLGSGLSTTSVLILVVKGALSLRSRIEKAIAASGIRISFEHLRSSYNIRYDKMFSAVSAHLAKLGKSISEPAFLLLRERCQNDLGNVFEELSKLVPFVGERTLIEEQDVRRIVPEPIANRIFELTDAIGQKNIPKALKALSSTLNSGEPPIKVHALITRQIRLMFQAKLIDQKGVIKGDVRMMDYRMFTDSVYKNIPKMAMDLLPDSRQYNLLKQKPYSIYQSLRMSVNFTLKELRYCMGRLLEADIALKTGQSNPDLILRNLIIDLCSQEQTGN